MSKINIEIDELTNCLWDVVNNTSVKTYYRDVIGDFEWWDEGIDFYISDYSTIDEYGFVDKDNTLPRFSWKLEREMFPRARFIELFVENDCRPQGRLCLNGNRIELVEAAPWNNGWWLSNYVTNNKQKEFLGVGGHLFAIAVNELYKENKSGELFFDSISGLQNYYQDTIGAKIIARGNGRNMVLLADDAYKIWNIYFGDDWYV